MPFISHDLKIIFAHIPKTGGASMKNAIKTASELNTCESVGSADAYHGHISRELGKFYKDYHKFVVVRNSYKLLASLYNFVYKRHIKKYCNNKEIMDTGFPNFKNWLLDKKYNKVINQLYYIKDEQGLLVDTVINYDKIEEDLDILNKRLNANIILPKKIHHFYGKYNWKDFYDAETKDIVSNLCKEDIEYFKFKFE